MSLMKHYILCQHGLLGTQSDFRTFSEHFHATAGNSVEVVILQESAGLTQTLDGVEAGGNRCMHEILNLVRNGTISTQSQISMIGHSLGGLYVRYALRQIEIEYPLLWDEYNLKRTLCIFLATPHCGVECSSWLIRHSVDRLFRHVSRTADDLSLKSPSLTELADDFGIKSLENFAGIAFYGNERGDNLVSPTSALALPSFYRSDIHSETSSNVLITELARKFQDDEGCDTRATIVNRINNGLKNIRRFLVRFQPGLPQIFSMVDNTAHHRIICHGVLDRGKAGIPVIEHIEALINSSD